MGFRTLEISRAAEIHIKEGISMGDFDKVKYKNEFAKEKYDRIIVNVPKGKRCVIDCYRKEKGYSSLNAYITDLIRRDMNESVE